jgi:hypothetical protein
MASVPTDKCHERALAFLVGKSGYTVRTLVMRLFKNDFTPLETSVVGDLTVADFTGYADATLASGDWTLSGTSPNLATAAVKTFTSSAGSQNQDIYGWYLVTATDNELIVAERFSDAPKNIANNGDAISVIARLTAANG